MVLTEWIIDDTCLVDPPSPTATSGHYFLWWCPCLRSSVLTNVQTNGRLCRWAWWVTLNSLAFLSLWPTDDNSHDFIAMTSQFRSLLYQYWYVLIKRKCKMMNFYIDCALCVEVLNFPYHKNMPWCSCS